MTAFASKAAAFKAKIAENRAQRELEDARRAQAERLAAMSPAERRQHARQKALIYMQRQITTAKNWPRKPDPSVHRDPHVLGSGWLLPVLMGIDDLLWGRWDYWARTRLAGRLLDEPIPQISFGHEGIADKGACRRMLEASLNSIPRHGEWRTWGSWQYIDYFFDWLLFGFGQHKEPPKEPEAGAFSRLYQVFCLEAMMAWPYDYFGDMLAEQQHGRSQGFYPTPHCLVELMTRMTFDDGADHRMQTVMEPCIGTGRMLMFASNYSLRLHGQDVNLTCVKASLVNLFLYAPWAVRPFPFLEHEAPKLSKVAEAS